MDNDQQPAAKEPAPAQSESAVAADVSPVDWARVYAFHVPVILIGGPLLMPLVYLFFADSTGLLDRDTARVYTYMFHHQPSRAVLLGLSGLVPAIYGFGTNLQFSLRRYFMAVVAFLLLTFIVLAGVARASPQGPLFIGPLGGGLLGIVVTAALGFAGLKTYDRLVQRPVPVGAEPTSKPALLRSRLLGVGFMVVAIAASWAVYTVMRPVSEYVGVRLGMSMAEVVSLRGQPYAVGDPTVSMLSDGRVVSLDGNGVPVETDETRKEQALKEAAANMPSGLSEGAILGRMFASIPVIEKHELMTQLFAQPKHPGGWRMLPDLVMASDLSGRGRSLEDSRTWFFEVEKGQGLLRLNFDASRRVTGIWCLAAQARGCAPLRKVPIGMSDDQVVELLGYPTVSEHPVDRKAMVKRYENLNVVLYLREKLVYMMGVEEPYR
jgi:hypothetical protein